MAWFLPIHIAIILLLTTVGIAFPVESEGTSSINNALKRQAFGVYYCTGEDWSGTCNYQSLEEHLSTSLPAEFFHNVKSIGCEEGLWCNIAGNNGLGPQRYFGYPGIPALDAVSTSEAETVACGKEFT